ncbi:hypothetical protein D9M69_512380 [compost metagenome]
MRHVAVERVQQEQRFVGRRAADVHMLAKHGELFGEIAVQARELFETRLGEDALLEPALERVRATARDLDVEPVARAHQGVADLAQLRQQRAVFGLDVGRDLDHALRHLGRDHPREGLAPQQLQQVVGAAGQVHVVGVDELQFQLHAHGQRLR